MDTLQESVTGERNHSPLDVAPQDILGVLGLESRACVLDELIRLQNIRPDL